MWLMAAIYEAGRSVRLRSENKFQSSKLYNGHIEEIQSHSLILLLHSISFWISRHWAGTLILHQNFSLLTWYCNNWWDNSFEGLPGHIISVVRPLQSAAHHCHHIKRDIPPYWMQLPSWINIHKAMNLNNPSCPLSWTWADSPFKVLLPKHSINSPAWTQPNVPKYKSHGFHAIFSHPIAISKVVQVPHTMPNVQWNWGLWDRNQYNHSNQFYRKHIIRVLPLYCLDRVVLSTHKYKKTEHSSEAGPAFQKWSGHCK